MHKNESPADVTRPREADPKRSTEAGKRRRRLWHSAASALWPPSRPTPLVASLVSIAVLGAFAAWNINAPPIPAPSAPEPIPVAPSTNIVSTLSPDRARGLKPKDTFTECSSCPQMIVVPPGSFTMGSPASEPKRFPTEGPQHMVTFARPFAVQQFALTFEEWDACAVEHGCNGYKPSDQGWGRGRQPVINVSWNDAQAYVAWLSKKTGKSYRLLTEPEYEYATRAGMQTAYPWGNDIGEGNANCDGCGSRWDFKQTAPVGSFAANAFGLYEMVGDVWAWTEDCWHGDYTGAPADGSAWKTGNCMLRVVRGGSWDDLSGNVRSARRNWDRSDDRSNNLGFRVGLTLLPP